MTRSCPACSRPLGRQRNDGIRHGLCSRCESAAMTQAFAPLDSAVAASLHPPLHRNRDRAAEPV